MDLSPEVGVVEVGRECAHVRVGLDGDHRGVTISDIEMASVS